MSAGQAVHRATIIDAIWGEEPAPSAISMIQSYVSRLRDAFGPGGAEREGARRDELLVSVGESYQLQVRAEQLDALEFADLAARARQRAAAGDTAGACELYGGALGLWRGEVAADVGLLRGHPAVAALARQRTAVVLEYAEVAGRAGWHGRVLEQLRALAEREPLDERALARLMIALGATGQQAAALRVFEDARTRLDAELGVTPGPELAQAHLHILRGEVGPPAHAVLPSGAADGGMGPGDEDRPERRVARLGGAGSRASAVLPRQLPSAVRHFAGRGTELKALWEVLDQAGDRPGAVVICAIGGMAGVGKTALAVHWAQQVAGRFPDGQLFADLRGAGPAAEPAEPTQVIGWFLGSLGVPAAQVPADPQAQAALLRSVLADKRMLIVLDDARDAAQVRPLLPGSPGCLVLVTSRSRLTGLAASDDATVLDVDVLDPAEARELLARRLGQDRLAADQATAGELAELCGRLPLALAITAARAAARPTFPLAQLAAELRDEAERLDALDTGEPASSIRQVFSWSYRQLTEPAARMFRLLGIHPGPHVTIPAAASLAGVPVDVTRSQLAELIRCHLVTEPNPGRYGLHDLLRAYAVEQAVAVDNETDWRAAQARVLDHCLRTAQAAALLLNPSREPEALPPAQPGVRPEHLSGHRHAVSWLEAEYQALLSAIALAARAGFDVYACQLPRAIWRLVDRQGNWQTQADIQRIALEAAIRLNDEAGQATIRRLLALACARLARYHEALGYLTESFEYYRQRGDRLGEARMHQSFSWVLENQNRPADALEHAEQALGLYQALGHQIGQAVTLNTVGWLHSLLGQHEPAMTFCRQALALSRELGHRQGQAAAWHSIGHAEHSLGRLREAAASCQHAVTIMRELGDHFYEAETLVNLGDICKEAGELPRARDAWQQAAAILDRLDAPDAAQVRARLLGLDHSNATGAGTIAPVAVSGCRDRSAK
jgi:DNA-binding SARP family transcriptional activator/tetratricopeptide (TPR) repeat protein